MKLFRLILIGAIGLSLQIKTTGQNIECGHDKAANYTFPKSQDGLGVLLEHVPMALFNEEVAPVYLKLRINSTRTIQSVVSRLFDYCQQEFVNIAYTDDGDGSDAIAQDGIYTSDMAICYNEPAPFETNFVLNRLRTTITMSDGEEFKYITRIGSFSINPANYLIDETIEIHKIEDQEIYHTNHIANYVLQRDYDELFQDFDMSLVHESVSELWVDEEPFLLLLATFFDTNLSTNSFSAFYINGLNTIQTFGDFSNNLINHELNHKWVNSLNTFGLSDNNGHWGFIERPHSAFGQGCFHGSFSTLNNEGYDIVYSLQDADYSQHNYFSDIELALMGLASLDDVSFPLRHVLSSGPCQNDGTIPGILSEMDKSTFEDELSKRKPAEINSILPFKFVVLSDVRMSDLEMQFLHDKIGQYSNFYERATQGLGSLDILLREMDSMSSLIDQDNDGFVRGEDCNDRNPSINPNAQEIFNNDIDEDCDGCKCKRIRNP